MEKLCKNCKFWKRNFNQNIKFYGKQNGSCLCEKLYYRESIKQKIKNNDSLFYWDSEGWNANFNTGENFGCIHFKNRGEK